MAFSSLASNLVPGDANGKEDVFVRDMLTGLVTLESVDSTGAQANDATHVHGISADGWHVTFSGPPNNLVLGDLNIADDVFVRDRACPPTVSYCTAGTTASGCTSLISASGVASASASSGFTLTAVNVEGLKPGLIFYGISGRNAVQWGTGGSSYLCVKTPTQRTPPVNSGGTNSACDGQLSIDFLSFMAANPSALGQPITAGQVYDAQAWFRDPATAKTTSLSDAVEWVMCP